MQLTGEGSRTTEGRELRELRERERDRQCETQLRELRCASVCMWWWCVYYLLTTSATADCSSSAVGTITVQVSISAYVASLDQHATHLHTVTAYASGSSSRARESESALLYCRCCACAAAAAALLLLHAAIIAGLRWWAAVHK
jgi:hypothetical protein